MISGIYTAVLMAAFLAIVGWAWSGRNRDRFEQAAQLPLRDGEPGAAGPAPGARQPATSGCGGTSCCCGRENEA